MWASIRSVVYLFVAFYFYVWLVFYKIDGVHRTHWTWELATLKASFIRVHFTHYIIDHWKLLFTLDLFPFCERWSMNISVRIHSLRRTHCWNIQFFGTILLSNYLISRCLRPGATAIFIFEPWIIPAIFLVLDVPLGNMRWEKPTHLSFIEHHWIILGGSSNLVVWICGLPLLLFICHFHSKK